MDTQEIIWIVVAVVVVLALVALAVWLVSRKKQHAETDYLQQADRLDPDAGTHPDAGQQGDPGGTHRA